jgi:hypothetical protein
MIEAQRYLTPEEEKEIEGLPEKQRNLMEHLKQEAHAQAVGKHLEWAQSRDDMIKGVLDVADKFGTHGRIAVMRQMQADLKRKTEQMDEDQTLREKYGDTYDDTMKAANKFTQSTLAGIEQHYVRAVAAGKTDIGDAPITVRLGPGTLDSFDLHGVKNMQELGDYAPDVLANIDLDEVMPDPEEFEGDRIRVDMSLPEEKRAKKAKEGWIGRYVEERKKFSEPDADDYLEQKFAEHMEIDNRDATWMRDRLGRVAKYHPELKGKSPEELAKIPEDQLSRLVATSDARRIKQIVVKRDLKERQAEVRLIEHKRRKAELKGKRTQSYVSDATAAQIAKFKHLEEKGEPGILRRFGTGLKDAVMGTLDVADRAVGVAGHAAEVGTAGTSLYKKINTVNAHIERAFAKAQTETAKAGEAEPQAKAETKKAELANEATGEEVKMAKSKYTWRILYHLKDSGVLRMVTKLLLGAGSGFMTGGPLGALGGAGLAAVSG